MGAHSWYWNRKCEAESNNREVPDGPSPECWVSKLTSPFISGRLGSEMVRIAPCIIQAAVGRRDLGGTIQRDSTLWGRETSLWAPFMSTCVLWTISPTLMASTTTLNKWFNLYFYPQCLLSPRYLIQPHLEHLHVRFSRHLTHLTQSSLIPLAPHTLMSVPHSSY